MYIFLFNFFWWDNVSFSWCNIRYFGSLKVAIRKQGNWCYYQSLAKGNANFNLKSCYRRSHQRPATFLKKWLWYRCFPVNFVKFLKTTFLQNTSEQLFLLLSRWVICINYNIQFSFDEPLHSIAASKSFHSLWEFRQYRQHMGKIFQTFTVWYLSTADEVQLKVTYHKMLSQYEHLKPILSSATFKESNYFIKNVYVKRFLYSIS